MALRAKGVPVAGGGLIPRINLMVTRLWDGLASIRIYSRWLIARSRSSESRCVLSWCFAVCISNILTRYSFADSVLFESIVQHLEAAATGYGCTAISPTSSGFYSISVGHAARRCGLRVRALVLWSKWLSAERDCTRRCSLLRLP